MKLLVQPGAGVMPLVQAIEGARQSIEIVIFRFDRGEIERALRAAVERGVYVRALVAHTSRGGEKNLRKLELQLLDDGVNVVRTADDLLRYHAKFMVIDRKILYLLAFNFTYQDVEHSRSFAVVIKERKVVEEAIKLFEADSRRKPYAPSLTGFVVSPSNSRKLLARFISGARERLWIYDPKVSDPAMIRLLQERVQAGVDVRIIGRMTRSRAKLDVRKLPRLRLHTRTIIRDGSAAFIGSQSLRKLELDSRREVGIIFRDRTPVNQLVKTFEDDWALAAKAAVEAELEKAPAGRAAKIVAKAITKDLPPFAPVVENAVKEVVGESVKVDLDPKEVEATVKEAVKEAVTGIVNEAVREVAEDEPVKDTK